ncbi:large ribosomal subunit protein mL48 [Linepithema humile]|uniref:large ribosomal subunit protein mL48 n=1 Tax=Linepithema humile TaxID=83485 RepID=UPI0006238400|nr:PREDICTED: probable 28S ribosomal protein S10, mitochondrial [Linepithema humile]
MALNLIKQITVLGQRPLIRKIISAKFYTGSLYEPDYLEIGKSKVPLLPTINIQIKGYDYSVLESYQTFMHKLAETMQIDVDNSWPLPHQEFKIQKYKTGTTAVVSEYNLKIYERHMQLSDMSSMKCSILIRALEAALPQGVTLNIDVYDPAIEMKRYVPDKELLDLKSSLNEFKKS